MENINIVTRLQVTHWFKESFETFKKVPGFMIGFFIIETAISWLANVIPVLGFPISFVLSSLMAVSWFLIAQKTEQNTPLEWKDIFLGFNDKSFAVIIFVLVYIFLICISFVPLFITAGVGLIISFAKTKAIAIPSFSIGLVLSAALSIFALSLVVMAAVFALPLVALKNMDVLQALKTGLNVWFVNLWPLTWFGLICIGLFLICIPTMGLGIFVVMPVIKLAAYKAYRDLFNQPLTPENSLTTS